MTERPASKIDVADDDYRQSHLQRGDSYDATIAAAPFDYYMAQLERDYLMKVVPTLFPSERPRYLDFACGTGRITQTVAPMTAEANGVDISPSMLQEAQRKCPNVRFVHADLTRAEIDLGQFDLVTSFRFFGNAQDELRINVLRTLNRLVRNGGYLIVNNHRNPYSAASTALRLAGIDSGLDLTHSKFKRLLRTHGFEIERTHPIGVWMFRSKLMVADPQSARAKRLEAIFGRSMFTPIAPDAVLICRKTRSL